MDVTAKGYANPIETSIPQNFSRRPSVKSFAPGAPVLERKSSSLKKNISLRSVGKSFLGTRFRKTVSSFLGKDYSEKVGGMNLDCTWGCIFTVRYLLCLDISYIITLI